jgi:hypothetical protein
MLYEQCQVTDIKDPEDKGRVKVKFLRTDMTTETWIPLVDSVFSKGDNGWDGELAVDDLIVISFFDYPENQKPFVFGKVKSKSQTAKREGKETLKIKDHKVIFEDDKVTVIHKNAKTKMILEDGVVKISSDGTNLYSAVRLETLKLWLTTHFHLGNLGYPVATTEASAFPWVDEIASKDIIIT